MPTAFEKIRYLAMKIEGVCEDEGFSFVFAAHEAKPEHDHFEMVVIANATRNGGVRCNAMNDIVRAAMKHCEATPRVIN